jgi:hypothetical protein
MKLNSSKKQSNHHTIQKSLNRIMGHILAAVNGSVNPLSVTVIYEF